MMMTMIIYIIPFFHRTFLSFYLICVDNVLWEQGKVLLNRFFRRENRERVNHPAFRFHLGGEKRCLNDTLDLEKLILREAPVSLPIPPVQYSMPSSRQYPFLTQVLRGSSQTAKFSTSAGTALNIPTYVTSLCSSIFPRFSQTNPLAHPCHLLWAPHSPFIRFITFAVICFICLPIWMKIPGQQGLSPLYPPGPNRLNWHTVGASEVHTHLHAFAHAAPSASNACTHISVC